MMRLDVRWRLTLWYGLALAGLMAGFGGLVYALMERQLLVRTDFELTEELAELELEVQLAPTEADLLSELRRRFATHNGFEFQVNRPDGSELFRSNGLRSSPLSAPVRLGSPEFADGAFETRPWSDGDEMRVAGRRVQSAWGACLVQTAISLSENRAVLRSLLGMLLGIGLPAVLLALGAGYALARHALSPVDRMTAAAARISGAALGERLSIANPSDELGRLATTLNAMMDRVQHSMEELQRFTADAAHELRTPLAVLRTETEIALRADRSPEEYRRVIEAALRETTRLSRLAERLLLLARHDAGLLPPPTDEVPLGALLCDVVEQLRNSAEQKAVAIRVGRLDDSPVRGDDIQLSQVLFNLVENAIKYTPSGGEVAVSVERHNGDVWLSVRDTGVGVAPQDLPHVFERFYRGDKSRNNGTGGVGLGLAICQAVVTRHGGEVRLESRPERGTAACVRLPAAH